MKNLLPNSKKGAPPKIDAPQTNNLNRVAPSDMEQVNMKIPADKKTEMMIYAREKRMSLTELLLAAFDHAKSTGAL